MKLFHFTVWVKGVNWTHVQMPLIALNMEEAARAAGRVLDHLQQSGGRLDYYNMSIEAA